MDSFIKLAKQGLESYTDAHKSSSQSDVLKTGGAEYNSLNNQPQGRYEYGSGYYQGGSNNDSNSSGGGHGGGYGGPSCESPHYPWIAFPLTLLRIYVVDKDEVVKTANQHGSGESSLFSTALSFLSDNKSDQTRPLDEDDIQRAHKKAYEENSPGGLSASLLGSAAAMQASIVLKNFTGGSSQPAKDSGGMSKLISLAMAEATKLFDKSGGTTSGNKQDAVNGAAMTVMKLMVQSKLGGSTTGGKDSGGLGQLMDLAAKFAK